MGRAGWRDGRHSQASRREADSVSPWRSVVGVVARSRRTTIGGRRETAIPWDPGEYLRFGDERTRPAVDLASRIAVESPRAVIDLGCGPGNSTQVLRRRSPRARISGLDSSAPMIARARRSYPDQEWVLGDLASWEAGAPCDVVFSNVALQWAHDHASLIGRFFSKVAPGGALAFQIRSGDYSAVRSCVHETSRDQAWASRMEGARAALTTEAPSFYDDALAPQASSVEMWETEYRHVMESASAIVGWVSSTGPRPFLEALESDGQKRRFVEMLTVRFADRYAPQVDERVLFPFRPPFVIAQAHGASSGLDPGHLPVSTAGGPSRGCP